MIQTYFNDMGALLLDEQHPLRKAQKNDEVKVLAEAKTLLILQELDPKRLRQ